MMRAKTLFVVVFLAGLFIFSACEEDPLNLFSDDPRDGLTGEWNVEEDSELFKKSSKGFYLVNMDIDPSDSTAMFISNFYELSGELKIILDGRNVDIPEQTISGYTIKGYGLVSFDYESIDWSYTVDLNTGEKDNVTAKYTRPEN